jgi:hypothetical protein
MAREPLLDPTPIAELKPTQITVGFHEVAEKRKRWAEMTKDKRNAFLARHMVPVLLGPKDRRYVIDHHHLVRALHEEGCTEVLTTVVKDLSSLDKDAFWVFADNSGWCHPYGADGTRKDFADIPKSIDDLADDPYRSLAGAIRRAGGCAKTTAPFSEFLWADFLRRRIKPKQVAADFTSSAVQALALAKSQDAKFLPGWCGPDPEA